jgi:hypothetical protein
MGHENNEMLKPTGALLLTGLASEDGVARGGEEKDSKIDFSYYFPIAFQSWCSKSVFERKKKRKTSEILFVLCKPKAPQALPRRM